jgi:hypothetical protein
MWSISTIFKEMLDDKGCFAMAENRPLKDPLTELRVDRNPKIPSYSCASGSET